FDVQALGLTGFTVVNDNNRPFTPRETGVPTITVNSFSTLAEQDGGNGFDYNNLHQFNDNVTWAHGSHTTKAGFDYRWVSLFRGAANVPRGGLTFNGDIANDGFAAFLLGLPSSTVTPEGRCCAPGSAFTTTSHRSKASSIETRNSCLKVP